MRPIVAIACLLCTAAYGQITVPKETPEYNPIHISVTAEIPTDGRIITSGPGWILSPGINAYRVSPTEMVVCAPPGNYSVAYKIFWIHLQEVKFKDFDGNEVSIWSYISHGNYDTHAAFKILGEVDPGPDPTPDPDPPNPDGKWQIMLYYDSSRLDNYPRGQRLLLTSLSLRKQLVTSGHNVILTHDVRQDSGSMPDWFKPWADAVKGDTMPRIALAPYPMKKSDPIRDFPLPASEAALMELLR